ncbi:hypothetical protein AB0F81_12995 [Actinoplanes sp. NPDC024001]|uniref:hypothetical protein n=1 Tax=Actinoplanes sp. NPDC024001 TaxID=3154598 RepID=UPI003410AB80
MSAGWVAAGARATALARRRLGRDTVTAVAACTDLPHALSMLAGGPYRRHTHPGQSLAEAERGLAETLLWHLRVLAGWLPPRGAQTLRLLAGWFEIANVEERLHGDGGAVFRPGSLATAGARLSEAHTGEQIRAVLAASPWGDPGSSDPADIVRGMRLSWGERLAAHAPQTHPWVAGGVALLVADELFTDRRTLPPAALTAAGRVLGTRCLHAESLSQFRASLRPDARWAVTDASALDPWQAQISWWRRVRSDGDRLLAATTFDEQRPIGAASLLAVDAWQLRAALETAARGSVSEVFDVLA